MKQIFTTDSFDGWFTGLRDIRAKVRIQTRIDRAGLLRYIVSFRDHAEFHEQCVERIFIDLLARCRPQSIWMLRCNTLRRHSAKAPKAPISSPKSRKSARFAPRSTTASVSAAPTPA